MDYATLRRLSAKTDAQLRYILTDAKLALDLVESDDPEREAKYLAEISSAAQVLFTRALTRIPK